MLQGYSLEGSSCDGCAAGYYVPDPPAYLSIMVRSEGANACESDKIGSEMGRGWIWVNGADTLHGSVSSGDISHIGGRGHSVVVVNRHTGKVESAKTFDTNADAGADQALAKHLNKIADGMVVIIATGDEASDNCCEASGKYIAALATNLMTSPDEGTPDGYRAMYAIIGMKGATGDETWTRVSRSPGDADSCTGNKPAILVHSFKRCVHPRQRIRTRRSRALALSAVG